MVLSVGQIARLANERGRKMARLKATILWLTLIAVTASVLWHGIAGLGTRLGLWSLGFGLGTMSREWAPYVFYASMILGALTIILALVNPPRRITAVIVGLLAIVLPFTIKTQTDSIWASARTLPFIHDVTTDRDDPPMFTDAIMSLRNASESNPADYIGKRTRTRDGSEGELVSDLQASGYPDIVPIISDRPPMEAYDAALRAVESFGWDLVTDNREAGIIEATETTFWYGFKDDVIIRIRAGEQGGSIVDIRSLSRIGGSDLGKNADRIRDFRDAILM